MPCFFPDSIIYAIRSGCCCLTKHKINWIISRWAEYSFVFNSINMLLKKFQNFPSLTLFPSTVTICFDSFASKSVSVCWINFKLILDLQMMFIHLSSFCLHTIYQMKTSNNWLWIDKISGMSCVEKWIRE